MAEEIGEALIDVMPDLGDFEDTLVGGVSSASEEAADAATEALGQITESAEETAEDTVEAFEDAGEDIAGQFEEASEEATGSLDELADAAEDVADESVEAFEDAGDEIVDQFEEASEDAVDALEEISESASDTFDEVIDASEEASDAVEGVAESAGDLSASFDEAADDVVSAFDGVFAGIADDASAAADDASTALSDIDIDVGDLDGAFDGLIDDAEAAGAEIADSIGEGAAEAEDSLESLSSVGSATLDEVNDAAGDAGDQLAGSFGDAEDAALGSLGAVADAGGGIGAAIDGGSALATAALISIALSTRRTARRMRDLGDTSQETTEQISESAEQAAEAVQQIEPPDLSGGAVQPPQPEPPDFGPLQSGAEDVVEGLRVTFAHGFEQVRVTARQAVTQIVTILHDIAGSGEAPIVANALSRAFSDSIDEVITSFAGLSDEAVAQLHRIAGSGAANEVSQAMVRAFLDKGIEPIVDGLAIGVNRGVRWFDTLGESAADTMRDIARQDVDLGFERQGETIRRMREELAQLAASVSDHFDALAQGAEIEAFRDDAPSAYREVMEDVATALDATSDSAGRLGEELDQAFTDLVAQAENVDLDQLALQFRRVAGELAGPFQESALNVRNSVISMVDDVVEELHRIAGSGAADEVSQEMARALLGSIDRIVNGIEHGVIRGIGWFDELGQAVASNMQGVAQFDIASGVTDRADIIERMADEIRVLSENVRGHWEALAEGANIEAFDTEKPLVFRQTMEDLAIEFRTISERAGDLGDVLEDEFLNMAQNLEGIDLETLATRFRDTARRLVGPFAQSAVETRQNMRSMVEEVVAELHRIAGSGAASEVAEALRAAFNESMGEVQGIFARSRGEIVGELMELQDEGEAVPTILANRFAEVQSEIETAVAGGVASAGGVLAQFGEDTEENMAIVSQAFVNTAEGIDESFSWALDLVNQRFERSGGDIRTTLEQVETQFGVLRDTIDERVGEDVFDPLINGVVDARANTEQFEQEFSDQLGAIDQRLQESFAAVEEGGAYQELPEMFARAMAEFEGPLGEVVQDVSQSFDRTRVLALERIFDLRDQANAALQEVGEDADTSEVADRFENIGGEIVRSFENTTKQVSRLIEEALGSDIALSDDLHEGFETFASELQQDMQQAAGQAQDALGEIDPDVQAARMREVFSSMSESVSSIFDLMVTDVKETLGHMINPTPQHVADVIRNTLREAVDALGPIFEQLPDLVRTNFAQVEAGTMTTTEAVQDAFDQMNERIAIAFQGSQRDAVQQLRNIGVSAESASEIALQSFDELGESMDEIIGPTRSVAEAMADVSGPETGAEVVDQLTAGMSDLRSAADGAVNVVQQLIDSLTEVQEQSDFDQIVSGLQDVQGEEDIFGQMEQDLQGAGQEARILLDIFQSILEGGPGEMDVFEGGIASARDEVERLRQAMFDAMDEASAADVDLALDNAFEDAGTNIIQSMRNAQQHAVDRLNDIEVSQETQDRISDAFEQTIGDVQHMLDSAKSQWQTTVSGLGDDAAEAALAAEQPLADLAAALEVTIPGATQVAVDALDGMAVRTQSEIANAADVDIESFGTLGERAAAAVVDGMEGMIRSLRDQVADAGTAAVDALREGDFETAAEEIDEHLSIDPSLGIADLRDSVLDQLTQMGADSVDVTNSIHSAFARLSDELPGIFDDLRFFFQDALEGAGGDSEDVIEMIEGNVESGMANISGAIRSVINIARQRIRGLVDIHGQATEEIADDWENPLTSAEQMFDRISDAIGTAFGGGAERAAEVVQDAVNSMQGAFEGLDPEEAAEAVGDAFADIDLSVHIQQAMDEAEEALSQQGISGDQVTEALRTNIDAAAREMGEMLEGGVAEGMAAVEDAIETGREPMEALVDAVGDLSGEFEQSLGGAAEEASREITELVGATEDAADEMESMTEAAEEGLGAAADAAEELNESLEDTEEWVEDALGDSAVEAAEDFGEAVEEAAEDAEEALGDDVVEAAEGVQEALADDAVEAAEEFGESVEDATEDAQDALDETVDSVGEFTDAVDDAVEQVGDAASEMGDSFGGFRDAAIEAGEEIEESIGDSLQGTADVGSEVTDDLQQMFIETADAVEENFAAAAEEVGDSLEEEAAARGMEAFAEMEDSAEETAANVDDAFDGVGGGIADSFDTAAGGAEGGGGRISAAMAGAAGGAAASSGKIAAILSSSAVKFGAWAAAGVAAGGAVVEAFAQTEQDLNVAFANIDDALEDLRQSARDVAIDVANVTFPLDEVTTLIEVAQQRGLKTTEELENFAGFWDTVGDATGESATKLAELSPALELVGIEIGNEKEALDAFGFITRNTTAGISDLLQLVERAGQEFGEQTPGVNKMAAAVALLEDSGFRAQRAQRLLQRELRQTEGDLEAAIGQIGAANADRLPEFIAKVEGSGEAIEEQADNFREFRTPMEAVASVWDRLTTVFGDAAGTLSPLTELIEDMGDTVIGWAQDLRDAVESTEGFTSGLEAVLEQMGLVHESVDTPPAFHEVADEATAAFHEVADDSRGIADLIFEALGGAIEGLGSFIADNTDVIVDGLLSAKSAIVDAGLALFEGLVDALPQLVNDLVDGTVDLIDAIATVLVESTPAIVQGAVDLLTGLLDAIPVVLPMLIDGVLEIVLAITRALAENAEPLITAGVDALLVLIDGLVQALPVLIETISTEVIPALIDAIVENLPTIIEAGVDLIVALIDGLAKAIPRIVDAVFTEIIPAVTKALNDNEPKIQQAAEDIGWALINGLLSILDSLGQAVWDIADHIRRKFVEFLQPIIDTVVDWFRDLPGDAKVAIISQAFELVSAGRDLVRGIWDGITSMGDWLKGKLMDWAADVLPGPVADVLGLSSPSTVYADMGRDIVRGLIEGIEDEEDGVIAEIERFANEMSSIDLMLGDPSIGEVEGEIDRAAARRRGDGSREGGGGGDHVEVTVHQQPSETPVESTMRALRRARYLSTAGRRGARR